MIFRFPPTWDTDTYNSNNNLFRIKIGNKHRNPAAVGMQEYHQWMNRFKWHTLPGLAAITIGGILFGVTGLVLGFIIFLIFTVASLVPSIRRKHEFYGQVIEAVYAHLGYGRSLIDEMSRAAFQMKSSSYRNKLNISSWTQSQVEAALWELVPSVEKYCEEHQKEFDKLYVYFHVDKDIPLVP